MSDEVADLKAALVTQTERLRLAQARLAQIGALLDETSEDNPDPDLAYHVRKAMTWAPEPATT